MIKLKLFSKQNNPNVFTNVAIVNFYDTKKEFQWSLTGFFAGYDFKNKEKNTIGYIKIPIKGNITKLYENEELSENFTLYPKLSRKELRIIWLYLINNEDFQQSSFIEEEPNLNNLKEWLSS